MRAELVVAEDALMAAAIARRAGGGAAAVERWRRCRYRAVAVCATLAAMEDFELGE